MLLAPPVFEAFFCFKSLFEHAGAATDSSQRSVRACWHFHYSVSSWSDVSFAQISWPSAGLEVSRMTACLIRSCSSFQSWHGLPTCHSRDHHSGNLSLIPAGLLKIHWSARAVMGLMWVSEFHWSMVRWLGALHKLSVQENKSTPSTRLTISVMHKNMSVVRMQHALWGWSAGNRSFTLMITRKMISTICASIYFRVPFIYFILLILKVRQKQHQTYKRQP